MADPRWDYLNRFSLAYELHSRIAAVQTRSEAAEILLPELEAEMEAKVALMILTDRTTGRPTVFGGTEELRRKLGEFLRSLPLSELREALKAPARLVEHPHVSAVPVKAGLGEEGVLVVAGESHFGDPDRIALEAIGTFLSVFLRQVGLYEQLDRTYQELRQAREANTRNQLQSLGRLSAGIARDIGDALAPVTAYSSLLLSEGRTVDAEERRYLELIHQAGMDVTRTLDRMGDHHRKGVAEDKLLTAVEVPTLLNDAAELARSRAHVLGGRARPRVEVELDEGLSELVGDRGELRAALDQLTQNALEALSGEEGMLILRGRRATDAEERTQASGPLVVVEITDTGTGMDTEVLRRCTDPYFTTRDQAGAGLGLTHVRNILRRHGGRMEIESEPGKGTTVRMILPTGTGAAGEVTGGKTLRSRRVLVLDDDADMRLLVKEVLKQQGHRSVTAASGREGVETFVNALRSGEPFDVIVTDLDMPDGDGQAVIQAVKAVAPDTPVILLTGLGGASPRGRLPRGVSDILIKPLQADDLREALASLP